MCHIYDPRRGGRRSGVLGDKPLRARLWAVLAIFAVFAADRAVKRLLLSGAVELSGTALIPGVATSSHISFSAFRLAWPSLPTMRWSCTAIPSGRATSTIARVMSMSAREGVGFYSAKGA